MIRPQTPPISLHLFAVPLIRFLSNGGSHCVVSQCHLATHCKHLSPPYLYFMLLPFRPWAACCKASGVLVFGRRALSAEGGSSRNHGAAQPRVSSGCPTYRHPKGLQLCSTQQNDSRPLFLSGWFVYPNWLLRSRCSFFCLFFSLG